MNWLNLDVVEAAARAAADQGVSEVARSPRGFLPQYRSAGGNPDDLSAEWRRRRDGFVARHMAQVKARDEALFDVDGAPTRRHLALAVWAYSPYPRRLVRWLSARGFL
jgi:hypothetical protein